MRSPSHPDDAMRSAMRAIQASLAEPELAAKARAFHAMDEAIALERACSAMEAASQALAAAPWVHELHAKWRPSMHSAPHQPMRLLPELAPRSPDAVRFTTFSRLGAIIDFAIAASRLADGTLSPAHAAGSHLDTDTMKSAFALGSSGVGFDGRSAAALKGALALAESELGKALEWASRGDPAWMPSRLVGSQGWERAASAADCHAPEALATALGFPMLAAQIERRALGAAAGPANAQPSHPASL